MELKDYLKLVHRALYLKGIEKNLDNFINEEFEIDEREFWDFKECFDNYTVETILDERDKDDHNYWNCIIKITDRNGLKPETETFLKFKGYYSDIYSKAVYTQVKIVKPVIITKTIYV